MIYSKLLEVQKEIGAIKKDSENPFFKSKYFDINSLLAVVKPILNKHGLVLTQAITDLNDKIALNTTIMHVESEKYITSTCRIPEGLDAQKTGSAITYFRRYALQSLLALEAEDDDANIASTSSEKKEKKTTKGVIDQDKPPFGKGSEDNGAPF